MSVALPALWTDAAPFRHRYEKSATALLAIRRALERKRPLAGREGEALRLIDRLERASPESFGAAWGEPSSQWWVVLAWHLVGACLNPDAPSPEATAHVHALGVDDPREALAVHLEELKRIALGVAFLEGPAWSFERSLNARLPFALPGTPLVLTGTGRVSIRGARRGALEIDAPEGRCWITADSTVARAAEDAATPIVERSAEATCDGYALRLEPAALDLPGVTIAEPLRELRRGFQHEQASVVSTALDLIRRHQPESFAQLREMMRVAAMKPRDLSDYSNVSQSDLPGAFVCTATADPFVLADSIIHELHHNRLFFLQDEAPLFSGERDGVPAEGSFYSPWRDDLRPLQGLLHGAFVYVPVLRFWIAALAANAISGDRRLYALDQLARVPVQCAIAVTQLRRHARLTPLGDAVLAELAAELDRATGEAQMLGATLDAPATIFRDDGGFPPEPSNGGPITIRQSLHEHWSRFDVRRQLSKGDLDAASIADGE